MELNKLKDNAILPGQKLCYNCDKEWKKELEIFYTTPVQDLEATDEEDDASRLYEQESLNRSFSEFNLSPLKPGLISKQNMPAYAKRKYREYDTAISSKMARVLDVDPDNITATVKKNNTSVL